MGTFNRVALPKAIKGMSREQKIMLLKQIVAGKTDFIDMILFNDCLGENGEVKYFPDTFVQFGNIDGEDVVIADTFIFSTEEFEYFTKRHNIDLGNHTCSLIILKDVTTLGAWAGCYKWYRHESKRILSNSKTAVI